MTPLDGSLLTPIYVKSRDPMLWPDDKVFYLLADKLYLCRNHEFFSSSVPAPRWPSELAEHATQLTIRYPKIPREQMERICGFFDYVWREYAAEAIALFAWDRSVRCVRTVIPRQLAAVGGLASGRPYPIGVKYQSPKNLSSNLVVFCDIHSHCDMAAYSSSVDVDDEQSLTGLHMVVGRLQDEPPQVHVEAVVDGVRFSVRPAAVISGYKRRRYDFPGDWIDQVRVVDYPTYRETDMDANAHGDAADPVRPPSPADPPISLPHYTERNDAPSHNGNHPVTRPFDTSHEPRDHPNDEDISKP